MGRLGPERDLVGYGRRPPVANWPGGAKVALQIVVNYEEGGENTLLNGDQASEAFLSEIVAATPWPGRRHMNMESIYEYGSRVGFWRLHRILTARQIPVTVFAVGRALELYPEVVDPMLEAGWEIASHGYRWIDYAFVDEETEREHIAKAIEVHERLTGAKPAGWYTGRTSERSRRLVLEALDLRYDADSYADELPYWLAGPRGPHLVVPYTLDANDMRFATAQGFNSGEQFFTYLKDGLDLLLSEETPRMMSVGLHCRLAGRPGRARALERFLDYALKQEGVWFCRRIDIAEHWHAHHRPTDEKALFRV